MTLTNEDLSAITGLMQPLKKDIQEMRSDIQEIRSDIQEMRFDIQEMRSDIQDLDTRTTNVELTLENETNRNIQLLAENHINLIDKLNQSIKTADKSLVYEVEMTYLKSKVEHLEKEVAEIKNNIA